MGQPYIILPQKTACYALCLHIFLLKRCFFGTFQMFVTSQKADFPDLCVLVHSETQIIVGKVELGTFTVRLTHSFRVLQIIAVNQLLMLVLFIEKDCFCGEQCAHCVYCLDRYFFPPHHYNFHPNTKYPPFKQK